ncbi:hypothetical protein OBCHQ24_14735 [Oceanobacillus iheyensis]|nr:hypothetical protein OBCHQ24_14735 [Oceanobacillus iheyensis]
MAILNRTLEKGQQIEGEINLDNGEVIAIVANVLEENTLIQAKEVNLNKFGKIDTLINGAGGNHEDTITSGETQDLDGNAEKSFFDMTDEGFTNLFDKNFKGGAF